MENHIPLMIRVGLGLMFIGIGVFTVFGKHLLRNSGLEEDIEAGNSLIHRWYRWHTGLWESDLGVNGYRAYQSFWGVLIGILGFLILFGFIDLSDA